MDLKDTILTKKLLHVFILVTKDREGGTFFIQKYLTPSIPALTLEALEQGKEAEIIQNISEEEMQAICKQESVGKGLEIIYTLLKNALTRHPEEWKPLLEKQEYNQIKEQLDELLTQDAKEKEDKLSEIRKRFTV